MKAERGPSTTCRSPASPNCCSRAVTCSGVPTRTPVPITRVAPRRSRPRAWPGRTVPERYRQTRGTAHRRDVPPPPRASGRRESAGEVAQETAFQQGADPLLGGSDRNVGEQCRGDGRWIPPGVLGCCMDLGEVGSVVLWRGHRTNYWQPAVSVPSVRCNIRGPCAAIQISGVRPGGGSRSITARSSRHSRFQEASKDFIGVIDHFSTAGRSRDIGRHDLLPAERVREWRRVTPRRRCTATGSFVRQPAPRRLWGLHITQPRHEREGW